MKKKGVIFDMDGLMFDTQREYDQAYREIGLRDYGIHFTDEMLAEMVALGGEDMYRVLNRFFPELDGPEFIRRSHGRVREAVRAGITPMPGLDVLLAYLRQAGCPLGLNSGSARAIVESNLGSSGLAERFSGIVCGDEVEKGKPAPEGYLRAAALIGCAPEDCYVIEDSPNGVLAGYRAGCSVIMVPGGAREPGADIRAVCAGIYGSLADVKDAMEAGAL